MEIFVSQIMTGLSIGSILLLVALGLAIIYGVTGVINLAHGEFVMLGAYAAWFLQTQFGLGLLASLVPIFLLLALFGWLIEALVIRHLYDRPLDTILATWGIGVMAQQAIRLTAGGELRYVQMPESLSQSVNILGATDSAYRLFILFLSLGLFALTWGIYRYTSFGLKLRAITQNRAVASSFGINAGRIYRSTFAYGAGMAGLAGALVSPLKSVSPEMGTTYVVDAFMVVVLGGTQSLMGTLASSGILGELSGYLAFYSNDTIAKALVLLAIVVLIRFRPQGLFTARLRA
ncbi:MAG TPA: urea ABC transporter permease subunit UrtB [Mesorhizobium sp.]|jgi:urea transport system permease protein|uniref:urea ABC transporter permease subunit UrtB n=1 Tax=unclassified Mesorhizobium TaxID=325217 RepID=UPI0010114208|nr:MULTISPECIES: urea ABC transporter permease subunit UrtB [unclassified Mesorhizobium]MBR2690467.1 urea ABC transporter permease subunit UrtB [Aquamicrobium sp.]QAZ47048.1 urea ABC transporter permease subunit UrtB [Mesorhizobium sp. Pch-S]HEV2502586.1 urea ABC transporter permease subunit UrtB [Mesorhizobium sp.]